MEYQLSIRITIPWWMKLHIRALECFAAVTGMDIDMEKLETKVWRSLRAEVVRERLPNA
ncbi:hypothetical protein ABNQ24_12370 [Ralstonia pseudosolanacearum]|uniref:hypothetical protein n=1 Tax=Ralstonia pseudosolanacearum TaxID=1310165 RepID=UPI00336A0A98